VSVFSRLSKVSWIADVITPLAVILMECFWLYPWLVFIGKLPELQVQKTPLSLLSLIFLLGLSFIAMDSDKYHGLRVGGNFSGGAD
jgi:hypothetical protein